MTDPTITTMNPAACRTISAAMKDALAFVEETYGVTIEFRGGSYDSVAKTYRPKIIVSVGDAETAARNEFAAEARYFRPYDSIKAEDYGREFTYGRKTYALVGLKPRSPRFPLVARDVADGRLYKLPLAAFVGGPREAQS